jgi:hypothetical protein
MVIQGWCVGSGWLVAIMNIVNEILIDASSDSEHIIHFLKNHPAEVNFVDQDGISALHWFALLRIPLTALSGPSHVANSLLSSIWSEMEPMSISEVVNFNKLLSTSPSNSTLIKALIPLSPFHIDSSLSLSVFLSLSRSAPPTSSGQAPSQFWC